MNKDIKLSDLVKSKNVLLVGNSKSLLEKDNSKLIDSYEFVIRFNLSIGHLHKHSIGNKCDAWIYAMCMARACESTYNNAKNKPKVCVRYGEPFPLGETNIILDVVKDDVRKEVGVSSDLHPSTGIVTLYYLLNKAQCKSISLIGFDSFKKSNFYSSCNRAHLCHNLDAESEYIKRLFDDGKITLT